MTVKNAHNIITNTLKHPDCAQALLLGQPIQMKIGQGVWGKPLSGFVMDGDPNVVEYRIPHPEKVWVNVRANNTPPHTIHSYAHTTEKEALDFAARQSKTEYTMLVVARCTFSDRSYQQ